MERGYATGVLQDRVCKPGFASLRAAPGTVATNSPLLDAIEKTGETIASQQENEPLDTYMKIWGTETDPCSRGEIRLEGDRLSNVGETCTLASRGDHR